MFKTFVSLLSGHTLYTNNSANGIMAHEQLSLPLQFSVFYMGNLC